MTQNALCPLSHSSLHVVEYPDQFTILILYGYIQNLGLDIMLFITALLAVSAQDVRKSKQALHSPYYVIQKGVGYEAPIDIVRQLVRNKCFRLHDLKTKSVMKTRVAKRMMKKNRL
jgi:hypothetical protein